MFLLGVLLYAPVVIHGVFSAIKTITAFGLIAVIYLGVFCSVFAYVAWYCTMKYQQIAESVGISNVDSIFYEDIILFYDREQPTTLFFLGVAFIMYGVYLTEKNHIIKRYSHVLCRLR